MANCATIKKQVENQRYDRYVASIKTNGDFKINIRTDRNAVREEEWQLQVCKNCLEALSYKGYCQRHNAAQKDNAVTSFSIEEFFQKYAFQNIIQPKHTDVTSPLDIYTKDWQKVSKDYKRRKKHICENKDCRLNLKDYPSFLHVHHISGHKANNRDENLKALCLGCHAKEYQHGHLKSGEDYQKFIRAFPNHWSLK